jgi:hypothetical protein
VPERAEPGSTSASATWWAGDPPPPSVPFPLRRRRVARSQSPGCLGSFPRPSPAGTRRARRFASARSPKGCQHVERDQTPSQPPLATPNATLERAWAEGRALARIAQLQLDRAPSSRGRRTTSAGKQGSYLLDSTGGLDNRETSVSLRPVASRGVVATTNSTKAPIFRRMVSGLASGHGLVVVVAGGLAAAGGPAWPAPPVSAHSMVRSAASPFPPSAPS